MRKGYSGSKRTIIGYNAWIVEDVLNTPGQEIKDEIENAKRICNCKEVPSNSIVVKIQ